MEAKPEVGDLVLFDDGRVGMVVDLEEWGELFSVTLRFGNGTEMERTWRPSWKANPKPHGAGCICGSAPERTEGTLDFYRGGDGLWLYLMPAAAGRGVVVELAIMLGGEEPWDGVTQAVNQGWRATRELAFSEGCGWMQAERAKLLARPAKG